MGDSTYSAKSAITVIGVQKKNSATATANHGVSIVGMSESVKAAVATNLEVIDR